MVSNGNITGLVGRLVKQGLVDCRRAPDDGRARLVELTPEGRRTIRAVAASHELWIVEVLGKPGPTNR
jgi:DNA-binding MarR family transcriptional regulator